MRNVLTARALLLDAARKLGLRPETIDEIFAGAPTDFQVIASPSLPFRAEKLGMIGITLSGRVHLLEGTLSYPPAELIALLRHEAEHVRQQREGRWFYIRYVAGWLRGVLHPGRNGATGRFGGLRGRWHRAYRGIGAEEEAHGAEERARDLINRK